MTPLGATVQEAVLELSARGGRIAAGGGLFAGGPFAAGLIAGGLFASGLNAATRRYMPLSGAYNQEMAAIRLILTAEYERLGPN